MLAAATASSAIFAINVARLGKRRRNTWDSHHAVPQVHRTHPEFADFDFDAPRNLRGVPGAGQLQITRS
jgi:hypothetical protein